MHQLNLRQPKISRGLALRTSLGAVILAGTGATALALTHPAAVQAAVQAAVTLVTCSSTGACITGSNSSSGYGVLGLSTTGRGVWGESTSSGTGTYGSSLNGTGTWGASTYGNAIQGSSFSGTALYGVSSTGAGLFAETAETSGYSGAAAYVTANSGYGLVAYSNGYPALFGYNLNNSGNSASEIGGEIIGNHIGLDAEAPASGGYPIVARDTSGNDLFYVNGLGDVYAKGNFNTLAAVAGGHVATAFGSQSTAPTIEDTGTARLVAGAATVTLDPTFAGAIDPHATYRIFVTPNGDTRGLFVAAKTPTGFIVRESQAGHSTVTFDYRVIGSALGKSTQRMAVATTADVRPLAGAIVLPHTPARAQVPAPVLSH